MKYFFALLIVFYLLPSEALAKSCKQKWAEYYAGASWFKPWCDTDSYKQRQRYNEDWDKPEYFDNDSMDDKESKGTVRKQKDSPASYKVRFDKPVYAKSKSCTNCIDIYADISNTYDYRGISKVVLDCKVEFNDAGKSHIKKTTLYSSLGVNSRSIDGGLKGILKPGETRYVQLQGIPTKKYTGPTMTMPEQVSSDAKLTAIQCKVESVM